MYQHIEQNCAKKEDLLNLKENIIEEIRLMLAQVNIQQPLENGYNRLDTPKPPIDDNSSATSTRYDLDHDVIMRTRFSYPVNQVPEPGFFNGTVKDTELFCELCSATFKSFPNKSLPEEVKINFVQSRLRDSARSWFLSKYHDNLYPATMDELLNGIKTAFPNVAGPKLAQIQLLELKQNYGKINDYIEKFRNYSNLVQLEEKSLALIFFNGLHPKYKDEIKKLDTLPTTLEDIITKCIIFESSLQVNNKIKNSNKNPKRKFSNKNFRNKNKNNYQNNFKNNYFKNNNKNNSNNNGDSTIKVQKLTSKN